MSVNSIVEVNKNGSRFTTLKEDYLKELLENVQSEFSQIYMYIFWKIKT
jgi:hypothetical protein